MGPFSLILAWKLKNNLLKISVEGLKNTCSNDIVVSLVSVNIYLINLLFALTQKQRDGLSSLFCNLALEGTIRKVQENKIGFYLNESVVLTDSVQTNTLSANTECVGVSKETDLSATKTTKC
jgi:hypothetical protein